MLAELTKQIDSHGHSSLGSFRAQQITNTVWGIAILFDKATRCQAQSGSCSGSCLAV